MADTNDIQALENISTEADYSQINILCSIQCIKAQAFLIDKLRKQSERQKEVCRFISSSNLKLETEIKIAEQEIKSLNKAIETIKLGNVELNKEYLICKDTKAEILERIKIGKEKYGNLWSVTKKKYESIPTVKKMIQAKNTNETLQANINALINESQHLINQIKIKQKDVEAADKAYIIELARFFVQERPKVVLKINENNFKIKEVLNELEILSKDENTGYLHMTDGQLFPKNQEQSLDIVNDSSLNDNWLTLSKTADKETLVLPKLHLQNNDLDILCVKLDQLKKVDLQNTTSIKRLSSFTNLGSEENSNKKCRLEENLNENLISSYFDISLDIGEGKPRGKNYSEKKLIHILDDIKLDKKDALQIINKLEPTKFHETKYIIHPYENISNTQEKIETMALDDIQINEPMKIEEIDTTNLNKNVASGVVVEPPTQFLDISQTSQEKKAVSFDEPIEKEIILEQDNNVFPKQVNVSKSLEENILNNSAASQESFTTMKDLLLKKHNLDLSPTFVYTKNTLMQKQHEDNVTSKFFETINGVSHKNDIDIREHNKDKEQNEILTNNENNSNLPAYGNALSVEDYNNVTGSNQKGQVSNREAPVSGFLFNHGPQGIPDSLNVSISTTGFEDNEDFPQCIDSSILLSPKADISADVENIGHREVTSQEIPNFLTGLRKTGLSFFGCTSSSETKPDHGVQCQSSSFTFNFTNEENKSRGGLFSMFH